MQERLSKLRDLVTHNLQQAQNMQKQWYDKHTRDRHFRPGDQVLIFATNHKQQVIGRVAGTLHDYKETRQSKLRGSHA